jgi:hypothetical protein
MSHSNLFLHKSTEVADRNYSIAEINVRNLHNTISMRGRDGCFKVFTKTVKRSW